MTETMVSSFDERQLELAIIKLFTRQGYGYVDGKKLHRKFTDVLLRDDLSAFLKAHYAAADLSDVELQKIIQKLEFVPTAPLYLGNREAFSLVTEGFDFVRDDAGVPALHIDFIDFVHPENNSFKVVNQFSVEGDHLRRPDLLIFINGIPVVIFEFKTAIKEDATIEDAWEQITVRYARDIARLLRFNFLAVISDGANTQLGSVFTPYEYFYTWNKVNPEDPSRDGVGSLLTMIEGAFTKERLLQILRDFVFYPDNPAATSPIVARYPQFFAATKMLANIKDHLRPAGDGKGGTYFGATGCGKTYMMLYLARLIALREAEAFHNPTIIVLVDREDLDSQTSEIFVDATKFLHEESVRSIDSRSDLAVTLKDRPSGGVYITTIQKFCDTTGLLSDRSNIICISDEAHRTQSGVGAKLRQTDHGVFVTYGLAKYLRDAFPNATYCGVTGTPIDETTAVFGPIVDIYTMQEAANDGITVRIAYEPRLARVIVSDEKAKEIQAYYEQAAEAGATDEAIEESQRAMSAMRQIIADPDRLAQVAADIVEHFDSLTEQRPKVVQKAMIVCIDRAVAFALVKEVLQLRPDWGVPRKSMKEEELSQTELDELVALPRINLVATQGANDPEDLYEAAGTKQYRKMLDHQFKNTASNFQVAVVVDMWITGFDVPSLAVMYIDKPLQRHTLVQTISRVNRIYQGKDHGLVVDYIGIREQMLKALKLYGCEQSSPIDEISLSLQVVRNHLALISELLTGVDQTRFMVGSPIERLLCLNDAAEFVQRSKEMQNRFMGLTKRLKSAFEICVPSGELTDAEVTQAQFYLAVRSILYKQTKGDAPDAATMNRVVEKMVTEALACTGIESIIDADKRTDLFSEEVLAELERLRMPMTKFNVLVKLLNKAIGDYKRTNRVKAIEFDERLKAVVAKYNERDKLVFTSDVVDEFVNDLSDKLLEIMRDLEEDQNSFDQLGISFEEKAFYDILVKVRDTHQFTYADDKCIALAEEIKKLIDDKSQYADWATRDDIKNQLSRDLTVLLYRNGYPPEWDEEVFEQVMEQAENFKKHA